jgi:hypothetical protein
VSSGVKGVYYSYNRQSMYARFQDQKGRGRYHEVSVDWVDAHGEAAFHKAAYDAAIAVSVYLNVHKGSGDDALAAKTEDEDMRGGPVSKLEGLDVAESDVLDVAESVIMADSAECDDVAVDELAVDELDNVEEADGECACCAEADGEPLAADDAIALIAENLRSASEGSGDESSDDGSGKS